MGETRGRHTREPARYYYRRELDAVELLAAAAAGVGAGLAAFYLGRLWLQRTPLLLPEREAGVLRAQRSSRREPVTGLSRE